MSQYYKEKDCFDVISNQEGQLKRWSGVTAKQESVQHSTVHLDAHSLHSIGWVNEEILT